MDQILEQAKGIYEGEIDFEGQRLAEYITYGFLSLVGAVAFLVGFATQSIYQTLYVGLSGTVLTFLIVVPQWPFFNRNPQRWLPAKNTHAAIQGLDIQVNGQRVG